MFDQLHAPHITFEPVRVVAPSLTMAVWQFWRDAQKRPNWRIDGVSRQRTAARDRAGHVDVRGNAPGRSVGQGKD
jgi:hypothetical protein